MRGEAADYANPLRRWGDRHLPLQHAHGIGEATHAIPAQFHVEVEPAADNVQVIVDEPWQRASASQVDDASRGASEPHHVFLAPDSGEHAVADRYRTGGRVRGIECGKLPGPQNQVSTHAQTSLAVLIRPQLKAHKLL